MELVCCNSLDVFGPPLRQIFEQVECDILLFCNPCLELLVLENFQVFLELLDGYLLDCLISMNVTVKNDYKFSHV